MLPAPEHPGPCASPAVANARGPRLQVLDGWRAISILLVLGCHMLPLGPKRWEINDSAGLAGMALFFTLSGFLIVTTLDRNPSVPSFLIRRLSRIVPLALFATTVYLVVQAKGGPYYISHLFYYVNYDHAHLTPFTGHFWSLCVEVHFYLVAALLTAILGLRGLLLLPVMGLAITMLRVHQGVIVSIMTHLRVDEILAGAALALVWLGKLGRPGQWLGWALQEVPPPIWRSSSPRQASILPARSSISDPTWPHRSSAVPCWPPVFGTQRWPPGR